MSRYIDAEQLITEMEISIGNIYNHDIIKGIKIGIDLINSSPTADVVEVVRCKDCKYYVANYCTRDIKGRTNMFYMDSNDFCSYGKKVE